MNTNGEKFTMEKISVEFLIVFQYGKNGFSFFKVQKDVFVTNRIWYR